MKRNLFNIYTIFLLCGVLSVFMTLGCDAGKPTGNHAPPEPQPVAQEPEEESERVLVALEPNASGKADFAKEGDKHPMAPILVPLGQYFSVQDRLVLMQLKQAMDLFKANNNNKGPATHEEFMDKIIKEQKIKLPQLRNPDDQYQYDPDSGELMISAKKK